MISQSPHKPERVSSHVRGLDGIRALSFLLVLGGHSGFTWIPNGFGVTVFFFLSGYLITTLLRREWAQTGSISISQFYTRRAFRILPPFYCAMILAILLASIGVTDSVIHWNAVAVVQLFLTNYSLWIIGTTIPPPGLTILWSLAVEEHFYLLFPWLYRRLLRSGLCRLGQVTLFGGICGLALCWRITLMCGLHTSWYRVYTGTDTRIDSIIFGTILAIAANPVLDNLSRLRPRVCTVGALAGLLVLLATIAARDEVFRQTFRYTIQGLALFPLFLYVIRYSESPLTRILEMKWLVHIGELSYSLYLVHFMILAAVKTWLGVGPLTTLVLVFSLSYVLAFLLRWRVEMPSNRLRNQVLAKRQTKNSAVTCVA